MELIENAVKVNITGFLRHSIEVIREFEIVPSIVSEKHKILQILINLIGNAKKAIKDGGGDRQITLRIQNMDGEFVRVEVQDTGIGIPTEHLSRIFTHGFTTRDDGHGFGLHSSALVAKELGGALSVRSDGPGRGAIFTLTLPIHEASTTQEESTCKSR